MEIQQQNLSSGQKYPLFGLGTYNIQENMTEAVDAALRRGYRLFDTAKVYNNESHLGDALEVSLPKHSLNRADVVVQTKVLPYNDSERVRNDVLDSLAKLKTDYIDVVLIHYPKNNDCQNEDAVNRECRKVTYTVLLQLKAENKIRTVGVSNYEVSHIQEILADGQDLPSINQIELHPHFTRVELVQFCKSAGILVQAFSSLAKQNQELLDSSELQQIASSHNSNPLHVLLSWAYNQNIAIIPKSSNPSRIDENLREVLRTRLTQDEISKLSTLNRDKNYVGRCTGWLVV
ncbi:unnamed protein product [Auanema sp. JU1783]|nr:unnamed protein product [Auanema sp. JU1783]